MNSSHRWYLALGAALVTAFLLLALFADKVTTLSPYYVDIRLELLAPKPPFPPSALHPLGTDEFGRDLWSRVVYGSRLSLVFAFLVMAGRLVVAFPIAVVAAFGSRTADWLIGRFYVVTSAVPPLLVYLFILSAPRLRLIGFWPSATLTVALLTLVEWPRVAISLKGRMEQLLREQFVEGAIAAGATRTRLFTAHLLPHLVPGLLHMTAAEISRGLLTIAQMGLFGILVGGAVLERVPDGEVYKLVTATGLPEWGTMLASARRFITTAPWVPLVPASAFLLGVVGFNLLAQGLEGVNLSLDRLRAATTGRLSVHWRWAVLGLPVIALLWYFQGLPWGREAGVVALAHKQAGLLSSGDMDGFRRTLAPADSEYHAEILRLSAALLAEPHKGIAVEPREIKVAGNQAVADWAVTLQREDGSLSTTVRQVTLVRRWGRWYESREGYTTIAGQYTDLKAVYAPNAPEESAVDRRKEIRTLAVVSDQAFMKVAPLFGPDALQSVRPLVRLYPTMWDFKRTLSGNDERLITYVPGESIRVSPELLWENDALELQAVLEREMLKYLTDRYLGLQQANPLVTGAHQLARMQADEGRVPYWDWADTPFFTLPDLFAADLNRLSDREYSVYAAQAALLAAFLQEQLGAEQVQARLKELTSPGVLAGFLHMDPAQVAERYEHYVDQHLAGLSMLLRPEWRAEVPVALTDAVASRAAAVRQERSLADYTLTPLDVKIRENRATITLLERVVPTSGPSAATIRVQEWVDQKGQWQLAP